jgi:hypothetical protein
MNSDKGHYNYNDDNKVRSGQVRVKKDFLQLLKIAGKVA